MADSNTTNDGLIASVRNLLVDTPLSCAISPLTTSVLGPRSFTSPNLTPCSQSIPLHPALHHNFNHPPLRLHHGLSLLLLQLHSTDKSLSSSLPPVWLASSLTLRHDYAWYFRLDSTTILRCRHHPAHATYTHQSRSWKLHARPLTPSYGRISTSLEQQLWTSLFLARKSVTVSLPSPHHPPLHHSPLAAHTHAPPPSNSSLVLAWPRLHPPHGANVRVIILPTGSTGPYPVHNTSAA